MTWFGAASIKDFFTKSVRVGEATKCFFYPFLRSRNLKTNFMQLFQVWLKTSRREVDRSGRDHPADPNRDNFACSSFAIPHQTIQHHAIPHQKIQCNTTPNHTTQRMPHQVEITLACSSFTIPHQTIQHHAVLYNTIPHQIEITCAY